ncbi:MAG: hypothetical protein ABWY11_10520 [Umezawaea sp.]
MDGTTEPSAPEPMPGAWAPPPPAPKPGVIPLRVLTINEILSGAFQTLRRYPALLIGTAALVLLLSQSVSLLVSLPIIEDYQRALADMRTGRVPEGFQGMFWKQFAGNTASLVFGGLAQTFMTGLATVVVGRAVLGKPITFAEAWTELKPRAWRLIGVSLLYPIAVFAGFLLCVVPGIWAAVLFSLTVPALVLEKLPVRRSFKRSQALVRNAWWPTFGILIVAYLVAWVAGFVASIPFATSIVLSGPLTPDSAVFSTSALVLASLASVAAGAFTTPFISAVTALLYLDRRIEVERLDVTLAQAAAA